MFGRAASSCCAGFSLAVVSRGCSAAAECRLLSVVSLEHTGFSSASTWAQQLWLPGSRAQAQ